MYFIDYVKTWKPANKKCGEMIDFACQFEHKLVKDECSLDAMLNEIRQMATTLDAKYPKTMPLSVNTWCSFGTLKSIYCKTENSLDTNVFSLSCKKVMGTYEFSESTNQIEAQ